MTRRTEKKVQGIYWQFQTERKERRQHGQGKGKLNKRITRE
jgi:hypothetical protein